ncbi:MAG TPA: endo-1,4-beta-xylanase [Acidobacteriaceae bacterium]|jgi:endo-1,4-beta-xylanase|nr:endo-1,4-beta-xylanase [Acidobacteriaceae bacterium]
MFCAVDVWPKGLVRKPISAVLPALLALLLLGGGLLHAQVVQTYTFNDGTADGWSSFNGASTPAASNAETYGGSAYSLLTATNASGAGGPSINLTTVLQAGATYTITGYVRLLAGETATNANFTIRSTDATACASGGGTCYTTVGGYEDAVNDSGWAQIGGSYTVSPTESGLTLYAQLVGPTTQQSFYLADVVITETAPPPGGTPIASYTWKDGGVDGWAPFGNVTLQSVMPSPVDPVGDSNALLTTGRTSGYEGPSLNLLGVSGVAAGATYQISAYVMLQNPDSSGPTVTMSTKTANCATSGAYANIATSGPLSNTAWTKVQGTFTFSDLPGAPSSLVLYFQSSSATDSFYISDVAIGELAPAPLSPSEQDNSGITTTFADGSADGWTARAGSTLAVVSSPTPDPNNDANALEITGRTANYDGPEISVSNKMYTGSVYNLSVYVMMQPVDASSHVINMSLQVTYQGTTSYPSITSYPGITIPDDGKWHQIVVNNYTMGSQYATGEASLYLQTVPSSGNDLTSFLIDDFQLTYVAPPTIQTNIPSIYKTFSQFFPVGAEIDTTDLSGPHEQLLTMHFNSITSGNDFKWSYTEPNFQDYTFQVADEEAGEAVCHNMKIRGQNLVWATDAETPAYSIGDGTNSAANQATVTQNIQEHIQAEVQHFGTEVYAWDVVNEPIDPTQSDCLEHGPFYNVLGASYIDIAFRAARQYAPAGTKLFLNDYSLNDPTKLACLITVVKGMRARGVPIDGIGHEMHNSINYPSIAMMQNSIETVARELPGIEQQVTELDESVYNAGDDTSNYGNNIPPAVLDEQGWLYNQYFNLFRAERHNLTGVTFWGMADDDTWLDGFPVARTDYPLPFDMGLQAKPAYWGIVNADGNNIPGYGLKFALTSTNGPKTAQTWTITATNGDVGPSYTTEITGFTLRQVTGLKCSPVVTAPGGSLPVSLGDIPTSGTATAQFAVDFKGCGPFATFLLEVPWTQATYHTGTFLAYPYFKRWF